MNKQQQANKVLSEKLQVALNIIEAQKQKLENKSIETQVRNSTLKSHMHNSIVASHIVALRSSKYFVSESVVEETNKKNETKKVNILKVSDDFKKDCEFAVLEMIEKAKRE